MPGLGLKDRDAFAFCEVDQGQGIAFPWALAVLQAIIGAKIPRSSAASTSSGEASNVSNIRARIWSDSIAHRSDQILDAEAPIVLDKDF